MINCFFSCVKCFRPVNGTSIKTPWSGCPNQKGVKNRDEKDKIRSLIISIKNWTYSIDEYLKIPERNMNITPEAVVFSPSSIALILHELLGHRLESDDFHLLPNWKKKGKMHYRVMDYPGLPRTTGYTPFGDDGIKGKRVTLFDSKSLKSSFLTKNTGNLRAISEKFHPIVRQRNLVTKILDRNSQYHEPKLENKSYLYVNKISEGIIEFKSNSKLKPNCKFIVQESTFTNRKGEKIRLPPFEFTFLEEDLLKLKLFGKPEVFIPGGGCHKGYQRGLSISFNCHSGWLKM
jgi:hypothetical protein